MSWWEALVTAATKDCKRTESVGYGEVARKYSGYLNAFDAHVRKNVAKVVIATFGGARISYLCCLTAISPAFLGIVGRGRGC